MSTYIVGDIQGCSGPLKCLMEKIDFQPKTDQLWSVGDIVNRGPDSLETLRYLKNLGSSFRMVLGNHDLHLIAIHYGIKSLKSNDTLHSILEAPDREELISWLRHQPLVFRVGKDVVVHAGIPHIWSVKQALELSAEVESILHSDNPLPFLENMYGNAPTIWQDSLQGMTRLRVITNYLTRMRICSDIGALKLEYKKGIKSIPDGYTPWFTATRMKEDADYDIFFGHWAALRSETYLNKFHALDSGCIWGDKLTVYALEKNERIICNCGP